MLALTRHGRWEMLLGSLLLAGLAALLAWAWWPLSLLILAVWVWLISFFRDPERRCPAEPGIMVSPADGRVSDIIDLEHHDLLGGPAVRVGIFLSVFNVHVNRAPCDGKVKSRHYHKGTFISALRHSEASASNEANTIVLAEPAGDRPIAVVKQIAGLIARRIVCTPQVGQPVQRGQRIGMIKFGSRTELYIPKWLEPEVRVQVGQKVRGALDVIAVLRKPALAEEQPETA